MAAAYIKVFCNGELVRTFGGNKKEVRYMRDRYETMTVSEFIRNHPRFSGKCKRREDVVVIFRKK